MDVILSPFPFLATIIENEGIFTSRGATQFAPEKLLSPFLKLIYILYMNLTLFSFQVATTSEYFIRSVVTPFRCLREIGRSVQVVWGETLNVVGD